MSNTIKLVDGTENVCPHCEIKNSFIDEFVGYLTQLQDEQGELTTEQLAEELEFFYDESYKNGERSAYAKIGQFAEYSFNATIDDGDEDEDE